MSDIAAFLYARYDEDETRAKILAERQRGRWTDDIYDSPTTPYPDSPERIRADIKTKRQIVAAIGWHGTHPAMDAQINAETSAADILCFLAEPYRSHEDYDPEWRDR